MAADVVNGAGTGTGSSQNGRITVMGNRNNRQFQNPPPGAAITYLIAEFDLATGDTDLSLRWKAPRYYTGDDIT